MKRPTKTQYYLDIARTVALRSTCLRRRFGAVIVKNDQIISTGYNGAPRQTTNCIDLGYCIRQQKNIPSGQNYELCRAVHAEMNAVIHASRLDMAGADLYLTGIEVDSGELVSPVSPCLLCKRVIINAGINRVILPDGSGTFKYVDVDDWTIEERVSCLIEEHPRVTRLLPKQEASGGKQKVFRLPPLPSCLFFRLLPPLGYALDAFAVKAGFKAKVIGYALGLAAVSRSPAIYQPRLPYKRAAHRDIVGLSVWLSRSATARDLMPPTRINGISIAFLKAFNSSEK